MSDNNLFEYEIMVEQALRGVVRTALEQVKKDGLGGDHHFFITFHTDFPGVQIPDYLQEKYPEEMTIVLQYQFDDLQIRDDQFSVILSFNNVPERMVVPFEAITGFADPSVKFGLQFNVSIEDLEEMEDGTMDLAEYPGLDVDTNDLGAEDPMAGSKKKAGRAKKDGETEGEDDASKVVSLDEFRKS